MKIAIHQPQYHPWINYYRKIAKADIFVYLDNVQFQKNGLQNRNKIKTVSGESWITIPIKQSLVQKISAVETQGVKWKKKHFKTISQNYKSSAQLFRDLYANVYEDNVSQMSKINRRITDITCKYFNINTEMFLQSDLGICGTKSDLIIEICNHLNCSTYVSGPGALSYLEEDIFKENNISIEVMDNISLEYKQYFPEIDFVPDLSVLDFILCTKSSWNELIKF